VPLFFNNTTILLINNYSTDHEENLRFSSPKWKPLQTLLIKIRWHVFKMLFKNTLSVPYNSKHSLNSLRHIWNKVPVPNIPITGVVRDSDNKILKNMLTWIWNKTQCMYVKCNKSGTNHRRKFGKTEVNKKYIWKKNVKNVPYYPMLRYFKIVGYYLINTQYWCSNFNQ